jgi:threonine/homoserine/homoserine lactone efflux protein
MDFVIFCLVALISFAGSIQLGGVNLAVIETTLNRNFSAGILVAIGGCIPEFIYSFLALNGLHFIENNKQLLDFLNLLIIPVFLLMGILNLTKKQKTVVVNSNHKNLDFMKGFSLGMLNPQLLPFWFFILVFLGKYFTISRLSSKLAFVLGTGTGAFILLFSFAYLAQRYHSRITKMFQNYPINRVMGYLFISLAVIQVVKIYT